MESRAICPHLKATQMGTGRPQRLCNKKQTRQENKKNYQRKTTYMKCKTKTQARETTKTRKHIQQNTHKKHQKNKKQTQTKSWKNTRVPLELAKSEPGLSYGLNHTFFRAVSTLTIREPGTFSFSCASQILIMFQKYMYRTWVYPLSQMQDRERLHPLADQSTFETGRWIDTEPSVNVTSSISMAETSSSRIMKYVAQTTIANGFTGPVFERGPDLDIKNFTTSTTSNGSDLDGPGRPLSTDFVHLRVTENPLRCASL